MGEGDVAGSWKGDKGCGKTGIDAVPCNSAAQGLLEFAYLVLLNCSAGADPSLSVAAKPRAPTCRSSFQQRCPEELL